MATTSDKKYNTRAAAKKAVAEPVTKANKKKTTTRKETDRKYKKNMSSDEDDSDDDADYVVESDYTETETDLEDDDDEDTDTDFICSDGEEDEDQLAEKEYQKFLYGLFPSKYMKDKVSSTTLGGGSAGAMLVPADLIKHKKSSNKTCPPAPKKKKACRKIISEDEDSEMEDMEAKEFGEKNKTPTNFNISFVIDDSLGQQYKSPREALYDEDDYTEDEGETESEGDTASEADTAGDTEAETVSEASEEEEFTIKREKKKVSKKHEAVTDEAAALKKMKDMFSGLSEEERSSSIVKGLLNRLKGEEKQYMKTKEKESKKEKTKNTHKLKSLLREKDVMNDLKYFNEKMSIDEQKSVLEQIELIHKSTYTDKPYRLTLLEADIPVNYKASAYRKITTLRHMEPGGGEYYKMKNWVDTFMQIPFGKYRNLPITLDDGVEKCHAFMDNAKQILDQAVYGLNDAKLQIMQMVGQWIVNPGAIGTAIAIKGPMGTGKTTLVKEGISKILGRDFAFIALGGATDSSFLEGHSYTYEGSTWGKIVDLLIKCKSMNPVIYFDELDKISDTPKGEEIAGILTHLTDTSQNNQFHDRYFSEIDFDLSRCLFIFSYNDESKVNRILLDRMYKIQTKGYDQAQKTTIANSYLMPKICEQVKFKTEDIIIAEATMHYIIDNYTDKEDGVRTLKRCLEIIHTKLNLYRLMKPDTNIFEKEMSIKVEFPMTVTPEIVDKLIKKEVDNGAWKNMYM
jgi:ATP-dependent Lon protease